MAMNDILIRFIPIGTQRVKGAFDSSLDSLNRFSASIRKLSLGTRGFRMELLSVMFFGMGMDRMFSGLLKPTLDLIGAFDLMNLSLAVGLLPTGIALLDIGGLIMFFGPIVIPILVFVAALLFIASAIIFLIWLFKNWDKVSNKLKFSIAGLSIIIGSLLLFLSPLFGWIFIIIGAIILLMFVVKNWGKITGWLKEKWKAFFDWIIEKWNSIKETVSNMIPEPIKKIGGAIKSGFNKIFNKKQFGGFIPQTGMYQLHAGEQVIPANQTLSFAPIINISTTSGGLDISRLKSELNESWARQLGSLARR